MWNNVDVEQFNVTIFFLLFLIISSMLERHAKLVKFKIQDSKNNLTGGISKISSVVFGRGAILEERETLEMFAFGFNIHL